MELNSKIVTDPPRNAATVIILRDSPEGLQVLLMQRHQASGVLGGVHVFPGGKLDAADEHPELLERLSQSPLALRERLAEPELEAARAGGLFAAAIREAFEECRVLLGQAGPNESLTQRLEAALRQGHSWNEALQQLDARLDTAHLVPWSRWITPRQPSVTHKRFDTRFFVTRVDSGQTASHDNHEATDSVWITPRQALLDYWDHRIELAPPQIMSLSELARHSSSVSALAHAQRRVPPVVMPEAFDLDGQRVICYPGDPRHPVGQKAWEGPSRLLFKKGRFEPFGGISELID